MPKRKNSNLYEVTAQIDGKRRHFYGRTKNEALAKKKAYTDAMEKAPLSLEGFTLGEWCMAWVEEIKRDVSPQTYTSYKLTLRKHIARAQIGQIVLSGLTPSIFRTYWQQLLDTGLSARTVVYVHTLTKEALKQAVEDGAMINNPLGHVKRPRIERRPVSALNKDQIHKLLDTIDDEMYSRLVRVALGTGMRRGELQGLRWIDVDFKKKTVSVNQSVIRQDGHEVISPNLKTASSRRTITLDDKTMDVLRQQKIYCEEMRLKNGWRTSSLVFPRSGKLERPLTQNYVSKKFTIYCQRAGLSGFTFHSLRHTHATILVAAGVHFKIIQHRLGHSSFAVTMDTYSHVTPEMDQEAADAISIII